MDRAALRPRGAQLQLFFHRRSVKRILDSRVAISASRSNRHSAGIHFNFQDVAASLRGFRRNVTQQVELVLFAPDLLQAAEQVVGIKNRKAAGSVGERSQNLLVGRYRRRELRHDLP